MASIAMCRAVADTGRAIEGWAESHPEHPAAGPILAARNEDYWAHTRVTPEECAAAFDAARAAGYYVDAAQRQAERESDLALRESERYLRALGY